MMKIGGLINKEFNLDSESKNFLKNGTYLINGRSALLLILKEIKKKFDINKILVPYFACPSIIETIKYSKIKFDYYDYNLEKKKIILHNQKNVAILIIHYFGSINNNLKFRNCKFIKIEDFSHLFLNQKLLEKSKNSYIYASLRKHTHLQYGAWVNKKFKIKEINIKTKKLIINNQKNLSQILNKNEYQTAGEKFNKTIEKKYILKKLPLNLRKNFLKINWYFIRNRRVKNLEYLKKKVYKFSNFRFLRIKNNYFPLNFFILSNQRDQIKKFLYNKGIYTSIHWKIPKNKKFVFSCKLSNQILSLPIDQRYNLEHMNYIIKNLKVYDKDNRISK